MPPGSDAEEPSIPTFARDAAARRAFEFARAAHAGQKRKGDGAPYISHPLDVAALVEGRGGDQAMVAAAFLHDVLEDTETDAARIHGDFGADVGSLVVALTDNRHIDDYAARKDALRAQVERAGSRAIEIYLCDKVANSRDLHRLYALEGEAIGARYKAPIALRIAVWRGDLEMALHRLGESPLAAELAAELDAIDALRGAPATESA